MRIVAALLSFLLAWTAVAGNVTVNVTAPTKNTDGSTIPATGAQSLHHYRIEYGTCLGTSPNFLFGVKNGEVTFPATQLSTTVTSLNPGLACFRAYAANVAGDESDPTSAASATVASPRPMPPGSLTVQALVAYTVIKQRDRFVMLPVGTVPANTPCDPNQNVNGYYAVPHTAVTWSGDVQPEIVVAKCS